MASGEHEELHSLVEIPRPTSQQVNDDLLSQTNTLGQRFKTATPIFGVLVAVGVIGFIIKALDGFDDRKDWGYYAAIFAFLFTTCQSALLVSATMRLAKTHWRRPLARVSELFAIVGVFNLIIFLPLLWTIPEAEGRNSIWFEWPWGAPRLLDALAMIFLVLNGLALLWASSLPDLALYGRRYGGVRGALARLMSRGWKGTPLQWTVLKSGQIALGTFYFIFLIGVVFIISSDFSMALVPGWIDAIFPAFQAITCIQAGIATTMLTLYLVRRFGGHEKYIYMEVFWALSKLLIAFTLLWIYFWFAGFITFWYGRKPVEENVLQLFMIGPYRFAFYLAVFLSFVVPFLILMWNWVRKTPAGPSIASAVIICGVFFDKLRLYVASYSFTNDELAAALHHESEFVNNTFPATGADIPHFFVTNWPDYTDIMVILGGLAMPFFVYLIATKFLPVISIWETKEGYLLSSVKTILKRRYLVLAKPD